MRIKKSLSGYQIAFFLILGVIFLFHLGTLNFPLWSYDDGCLVDFALHGRIASWETLIPSFNRLAHSYGIWDSWLWQVSLVRTSLTLFGVSYWSLRVFPFLIHFAALLGLMVFLRRERISNGAIFGLLYYMTGTYFFTVSHSGRPEPGILALTVLNLFWSFKLKNRFIGFGVGLLTALGAGFHVNFTFIAAVVPFLILINEGSLLEKFYRFIYWGLGFFSGLTIFAFLLPGVEHIVYFFQFQNSIVSSSKIPLLSNPLALGPIVMRTLSSLNSRFTVFTPHLSFFLPSVIALELFSVVFLARRFSQLLRPEKALLICAIGFFLCYSWLEPHKQPKYFALIHPWFYISIFLVTDKLLRQVARMDFIDWSVLGGLHLVSGWAFIQNNLYVFTHIPFYFHRFFSRFSSLSILVKSGGAAASILLGIFLVWGGWRFLCRSTHRWGAVPVYVFSILFLFFGNEIVNLSQSFASGTLRPEYRRQLKNFIGEKRLVAPNYFFVLEPGLTLQCPYALNQAVASFPGFDPVEAIVKYRPSTVFWLESLPSIPAWLSKKNSPVTVDEGPVWVAPFNNLRIYRFHYPNAELREPQLYRHWKDTTSDGSPREG